MPAIMKANIRDKPSVSVLGFGPAEAAARFGSKRLAREWKTLAAMIRLYCRGQHKVASPCPECRQLLDFTEIRLEHCRFGSEKPACVSCFVHCYPGVRRRQISAVIAYARRPMLWRHPWLSWRQWLDGFHKVPPDFGLVECCYWGGE
jgi:hypothetical protein